MSEGSLKGAASYAAKINQILNEIERTQSDPIEKAVSVVVEAIQKKGSVFLFGTGHSHMLAEEGHFRAGGCAAVTPILASNLMIHESAINSGKFERIPGLAPVVLSRYDLKPDDVLIIFSNSGVNAAPVEAAMEAKRTGMKVIAVEALAYAAQAPLSPLGKRLAEVADIVIDNRTPPGDALVEIGTDGLHCGPGSTIAGAFILNMILVEAMVRLEAGGEHAPVFISSNMPGAAEHNQRLLDQYKSRNPHL